MEDKKFKVGDKVRVLNDGGMSVSKVGEVVSVSKVDNDGNIIEIAEFKKRNPGVDYVYENEWYALVKRKGGIQIKQKPMKFALQYELDEDPTEYFATLPEVKARLKVLADNRSLKRDRIFIHTLAKTERVELGTSIAIKKA